MVVQELGNDRTMVHRDGPELVFERVFDAPRELVWKVLTDPEQVTHWWGPRGYTATVVEMDVRVGGRWHWISNGRDGQHAPMKGEYLEVEPPERMVQTEIYDVPPFNEMGAAVNTLILEDVGGRTKLTARSRYPSTEILDGALATGMIGGALESYDRLAELIAAA